MKKEAKQLIREALRQGWTMEESRNHPKLVAPDGTKISFSRRARGSYVATIKQMRQHGFEPKGAR